MTYDVHCNGCSYYEQHHLTKDKMTTLVSPPVELENNHSDILLVFQSPGKEEWLVGKAIQPIKKQGGTAGRRIELSWGRCRAKRTDFNIVNTVQCYPGNQGGRDIDPNKKAIHCCSNRLKDILQTGCYKKVIVFGDIALKVIRKLLVGEISAVVVVARHPNGGISNDKLDALWIER